MDNLPQSRSEKDYGADIKSTPGHESASYEDTDAVVPNEEEKRTLRRVAGHIPISAWLVVIVELAERFSYYGTTGPMVNYIQRPLPPGGNGAGAPPKGTEIRPGALGKGQKASTGITNCFSFLAFVTPIFGAIIADLYWGKLKTLVVFVIVGGIGHVILVGTAAPSLLKNSPNGSLAGLVIAIIIMGVATGAIKANVSPLVAEQIPDTQETVKTLPSGEKVIVDPNLTIQRVFMYFYLMINIGSLGSLATTETELHHGFWLAYLIPTIVYFIVPFILFVGGRRYIVYPPRGSILVEFIRVIRRANQGVWSLNMRESLQRFNDPSKWDKARPSVVGGGDVEQHQEVAGRGSMIPTWDDTFVDEVRRTLKATKIFAFYPLFWVPYNQMTGNIVSQAGVMTTHGVPNDLLQNINAIAIIIIIPVMDRVVYPGLRRMGWVVRPIQRITFGFMFASAAMIYAAVLQDKIYKTNPCGKYVTACDSPSTINVWVQTPAYILIAVGEIFASVSGLEYAYNKAPLRMKSVVMAMFLLTTAVGNALTWALVPVSEDPYLVWNYGGCAIASFVAGTAFWVLFHHLDATEEEQNKIGRQIPGQGRLTREGDVEK
ncbi:peptide transporter PTR2 [Ceratobasidium sp. AG-Ba]|nr:peptide transporter PTR2 [Ceratobasidium sp. AG-Ba]